MHNQSIAEIHSNLLKGEYSRVELLQHFLQRIKKYDGEINAFISVDEDRALVRAKKLDQKNLSNSKLSGIPIAHKDIFCTKDIKTSCASKMLDNFIAPYNATVVNNFNHDETIMLGKTNMDEFAMGASTENSFYGPTKNPWDFSRVPGGSSGGSAAAIAAGLIPGTTGTDTGGSIRQPASFCGISGIKPTYGRVSRFGMIAYASSLDQGGPMARSVEDLSIMLQSMAGHDQKDSTSVDTPVPDYFANLGNSVKGKTLGLPKQFMNDDLDSKIANKMQEFINQLTTLGAQIHEIDLPNVALSVPTYYIIAPSECSSNLARFDGVRYGYRHPSPKNLEELYTKSRGEGFGSEVKRRIMLGTYTLSAGYYDAYYLKAQKIRRIIRDDFLKAFENIDAIICPTTPTTAFKLGEKVNDPISMYLSDVFTGCVNLAGLPGLSLPIGFIDKLPIGAQIIGNHFDEATILNIGHQYQLNTDWHKQMPKQFT